MPLLVIAFALTTTALVKGFALVNPFFDLCGGAFRYQVDKYNLHAVAETIFDSFHHQHLSNRVPTVAYREHLQI